MGQICESRTKFALGCDFGAFLAYLERYWQVWAAIPLLNSNLALGSVVERLSKGATVGCHMGTPLSADFISHGHHCFPAFKSVCATRVFFEQISLPVGELKRVPGVGKQELVVPRVFLCKIVSFCLYFGEFW